MWNVFKKKRKKEIFTPKGNYVKINYSPLWIEIDIKDNCSFEEYTKVMKLNTLEELPLRLLSLSSNISNAALAEQKIILLPINDNYYTIVQDNIFTIISERQINDDEIIEIELKINRQTKNYFITKYIHDTNLSTKEAKMYPLGLFEHFSLTKEEALKYANLILERLSSIREISKVIDLYRLYDYLSLVQLSNYMPVIENDKVALSTPIKSDRENLYTEKYINFDIVLKSTLEHVGSISFNYWNSDEFQYGGNVSYEIKEQFRHHHYATDALKLLRVLLKDHKYDGNKNLYIATLPDNKISQNVALNNDAELIYSGSVPEDDSINFIDQVKEVNIYQIKI